MIKNCFLIAIIFAGLHLPVNSQIELPRASPNAEVEQTVGLTEIKIEYSSPGVKGREGEIWGTLVPYGEVWRMGANHSTKISFDKDVKIEGNEIKRGVYSLGAIPGKGEWTLIFSNTKELGGWGDYDEANDALRIKVKPVKSDFNERLLYTVTDFDNEKSTVNMAWENLKVSFRVEVSTNEQAMAGIDAVLNPDWRAYAAAARYAFEEQKNYDKALEWINESIEKEKGWYNLWVKAQILKEQGKTKEAKTVAQGSMDIGLEAEKKGENFFYKERVQKALNEWK